MFTTLISICSLILGYFVGLLFKPKSGAVLTISGLLGVFSYIFFSAHGDEGSPSLAGGLGLVVAFLGPVMLLTYSFGILTGGLTRKFLSKKLYKVIITLVIFCILLIYA
ncbi:hypothetical protein [Methylomonas albis]|uniref:Membrane transporter protein n=1 Tax=Methylomonas albis TaxID=1854563 RepID=A0ABR9D4A6_9GAMM|nr:hypothetical protein [Methylomonas albis]MBD9357946.1 hypothetical protein [Methylomonas albis]